MSSWEGSRSRARKILPADWYLTFGDQTVDLDAKKHNFLHQLGIKIQQNQVSIVSLLSEVAENEANPAKKPMPNVNFLLILEGPVFDE